MIHLIIKIFNDLSLIDCPSVGLIYYFVKNRVILSRADLNLLVQEVVRGGLNVKVTHRGSSCPDASGSGSHNQYVKDSETSSE